MCHSPPSAGLCGHVLMVLAGVQERRKHTRAFWRLCCGKFVIISLAKASHVPKSTINVERHYPRVWTQKGMKDWSINAVNLHSREEIDQICVSERLAILDWREVRLEAGKPGRRMFKWSIWEMMRVQTKGLRLWRRGMQGSRESMNHTLFPLEFRTNWEIDTRVKQRQPIREYGFKSVARRAFSNSLDAVIVPPPG